jgi:sugar/nucleoside kinase (ribokinase family)
MKVYDVYGLGAALVDTEIEVCDELLTQCGVDKGVMTLVDEERQHELLGHLSDAMIASRRASGGSACNSVIASSFFGSKSFYSCKVAADDNGSFYLDDLERAGVDFNDNANAEAGITGKCLVMITPDAERSMNTFLGISERLSVAELDEEALANSNWLYYEGYLVTSPTGRAAAVKARELAEANNTKTALSFSDPGMVEFFKDGLSEMLGDGVDLVFCNEHEAKGWAGSDDLDEAVAAIKKVAKMFAITLGAEGALLFDGEKEIRIKGNPVKAVDTNGAGDMFAGAFMHAIAQGRSFQEAGDFASLASSRVVADFGPRLHPEQHEELLKEIGWHV